MIEELINSEAPLGVAPWDIEYLWDEIEIEPKVKTFTPSRIKPADISTTQSTTLDKQVLPYHNENNNKVAEFPTSNSSIRTKSIEIILPQNDDLDDKSNLKTSKDELKFLIIKEREQEISQSRNPKRSVVNVSYDKDLPILESLLKDDKFLDHSHTKSSQVKPFQCTICDYRCILKNALKTHMKIHTGEKPFQCTICDYRCIHKYSLKSHMKIHTGEKPFQCTICDYRCVRKSDFKTHMKIHTGEKSFQCTICDYRCIHKYSLKRHMLTHTGEKPIKCPLCDYKCIDNYSLKTHMKIHTGEKPFQCTICEYRCIQKSSLKIHMKIHTGEKPLQCAKCDYSCIRKGNLKSHMKIHIEEKPFQCTICDYMCIHKCHLKTHMKIHTGEKPSNVQYVTIGALINIV